jgi:hypothetical protein
MGLACTASGFLITPKLETEGDIVAEQHLNENGTDVSIVNERSLSEQMDYNYQVCRNALHEPTMYLTILFFALEGFTVPHFNEYLYYYATNELKINQFEWGLLIVSVVVSITLGIMVYSKYLKEYEPRTLICVGLLLSFMNSFFGLMLVYKYYEYLGISVELFMLVFMQPPIGISIAIAILVPHALMAKITPSHVEATVYAFATSILRGSRQLGGSLMGVLWNYLFIGMTTKNLKNMDKAIMIAMFCKLIPLTYIKMIPTLDQVRSV